jgi:hypothetical protein
MLYTWPYLSKNRSSGRLEGTGSQLLEASHHVGCYTYCEILGKGKEAGFPCVFVIDDDEEIGQ